MKFFRDARLGWMWARHPREVQMLGPCSCGCGVWRVKFRGVFYYLSESHYSLVAKCIAKRRGLR